MCDDILASYRDQIRKALEGSTKGVFVNESRDHAAVILQEFISHAKHSIHICCTRLSKDIYDNEDMLKSLRIAVDNAKSGGRNLEIKVFVRQQYSESEIFATELILAGAQIKTNVEASEGDICIIDGLHVRQENSVVDRRATVYVHDAEKASACDSLFIK